MQFFSFLCHLKHECKNLGIKTVMYTYKVIFAAYNMIHIYVYLQDQTAC